MYGAVAAVLCLYGVVVNTWDMQFFTEEVVGAVLAYGLIDIGFHVGVNYDGDGNVLVGDAVADGAGIGVGTYRWGSHRVLCVGVVQRVSGCPGVGIAARAARGLCVKCGRFTFAEFIEVGSGHGGHVGTFHAHGDLCRAAASALWVGDSDGVGLRGLQGYSLCGLAIRVGNHVGGFPVEVERTCRSGACRKVGGAAIDDGGGRC